MHSDSPGIRSTASTLPPFGISTWCGIIALFGCTILVPRIGPNGAFVDPVLAAILFFGFRSLKRQPYSPVRVLFRKTVPWLWLIALGTIVSLFGVGFPGWALRQIVVGVFSFSLFFAAYQLFIDERAHLAAFRTALVVAILFVVATLAIDGDLSVRQHGTFYHPNYAAHFLASAVLVTWPRIPTAREKALVVLAGVGMLFTASFGGLLMLVAAGGYQLVHNVRTRPALTALLLALAVASTWFVVVQGWRLQLELAPTRALSTTRFDRSQSGRLDTWQQVLSSVRTEPLGVGPGGVQGTDITAGGPEAHNAYIAYLVERGPIALLGLLGLGVALWRRGEPGGATRRLVVAFAASNAVRETLHYRHMWLILALAFAWEVADRLGVDPPTTPSANARHRLMSQR